MNKKETEKWFYVNNVVRPTLINELYVPSIDLKRHLTFCIECGHSFKQHISLHFSKHVSGQNILNYKCKKCKCYGQPTFSLNGNTWRTDNKVY